MSTPADRPDPAGPVDLVVVGAGIVGLAHAAEAVARGLRVVVLERDDRAVGASVRNFGHICTTAQSGRALDLARVARETWVDLGRKADLDVHEVGTVVVARAADEDDVLAELAAERGEDEVRLLAPDDPRVPFASPGGTSAAWFPRDLRVDPLRAVGHLARWLTDAGADLRWRTHVAGLEDDGDGVLVRTSRGAVRARTAVVAVGHDLDRFFPDLTDAEQVRRCRLQMLEVEPPSGLRVVPAVLSGLSMLRYGAMAQTRAATRLHARIACEQPELLDVEMNLMLTQRPDGVIVLGDTHHHARTHGPFDDEDDAALLLREGARLLGLEPAALRVRRRWRGVYASSTLTDFLVESPLPAVRAVAVTSGIGMTTAFGLAPTVLDDLL